MATKSFIKNITIHDKASAKSLVSALEKASTMKTKNVTLSRTYTDASPETIEKLFCTIQKV